jgi:hypothetical protein
LAPRPPQTATFVCCLGHPSVLRMSASTPTRTLSQRH